jgi:hypothetical protein
MVPFKKTLSHIMNGPHTNHFCSMGTIMKFVINMEVLDAELERIEQISLFPKKGRQFATISHYGQFKAYTMEHLPIRRVDRPMIS